MHHEKIKSHFQKSYLIKNHHQSSIKKTNKNDKINHNVYNGYLRNNL